jgi:tetratricopeptide (TPR) repeat protein
MEGMKQVITALLFTIAFGTLGAQDPSALKAVFDSANTAYAAGQYAEAQAGYEQIVKTHLHFESEFNLGNAFFKQGQLGRSILHYERAKRLNPTNADLESNLILANARVIDRIESLPTAGIEDLWERILSPGRFPLWFRLMIGFWTLGFATLAWRFWQTSIGTRRIAGTVGSSLLIIGILCIAMAYGSSKRLNGSQEAIVLVDKANVLSEPSAAANTLFVLHEGTKVRILQQVDGQMEVAIANGNIGWLSASSLEEI